MGTAQSTGNNMNVLLLLSVLSLTWIHTSGHGRLMWPPGRSSLWRYGFNNPPNYNDNECNCGGFGNQWDINKGKCGVGGDNFSDEQPRHNEAGGKYGNGLIAYNYTQGQTLSVLLEITRAHGGYFEFRICENNDINQIVTDECLDKHLLVLEDGNTRVNQTLDGTGWYWYNMNLPEAVTCDQCVLQWHWYCGNNWGKCPDGTYAEGCGPQETFRGIADIAIH